MKRSHIRKHLEQLTASVNEVKDYGGHGAYSSQSGFSRGGASGADYQTTSVGKAPIRSGFWQPRNRTENAAGTGDYRGRSRLIPAPKGPEPTLAENTASPFQAEPRYGRTVERLRALRFYSRDKFFHSSIYWDGNAPRLSGDNHVQSHPRVNAALKMRSASR
jgi:hypothetical protein